MLDITVTSIGYPLYSALSLGLVALIIVMRRQASKAHSQRVIASRPETVAATGVALKGQVIPSPFISPQASLSTKNALAPELASEYAAKTIKLFKNSKLGPYDRQVQFSQLKQEYLARKGA